MPNTTDTTLRVDLAASPYDILIGEGVLSRCGAAIVARTASRSARVICDQAVVETLLPLVTASLQQAGFMLASPVIVPSGEKSKGFDQLQLVCGQILESGVDRGTILVALGGGVIGDLAGFTAAILLRGLPFVQMPTTLLSQVDSSVGGKTGINTPAGKNLVGAFHQPMLVLSDIAALDTLPAREISGGYAELVKHALIADATFFAWLESNVAAIIAGDRSLRQQAIARSCAIKAGIVSRDERETGDRALLNFGHTFGHAIEALTGFGDKVSHGEAVALGMAMAFDLSVRLGLCPEGDRQLVMAHFKAAGLKTGLDPAWKLDAASLRKAMETDKKKRDGQIKFVLADRIGLARTGVDVPEAELTATLETFTRL